VSSRVSEGTQYLPVRMQHYTQFHRAGNPHLQPLWPGKGLQIKQDLVGL